jgi:SNF2 family DNA or RNA helicase
VRPRMNRPAPGWTDFKTVPYSHQEKEFDLHRDEPARALIWQMRTGKTKAMIDLACYLFKRCEIDGVVVVAPNNVHLNWETRELPAHHWNSVRYASFVWDASKAIDVRYDQLFDRHCAEHRKLAWYMVNAEALGNEKGKKYLAKFLRTRWRILLIVDEVHEFRWATSKRSAGLRAVARQGKVPFRRILSANPIDNSPLHAFAEFEVLERGALGFEKYADFEARYGVKEDIYIPGGYSKDGTKRAPRKMPAITGFKNQDELRRKIAKWSSLVLREDCDDLPELLHGQVLFELTATQKRLHNDLVRAALARLDTGELIPPAEGGVLRIRLQQIASGFIKDEDNNTIDVVSEAKNPRMLALINSLNEVSGKAIIWCQFREDVVRVHRRINALDMGDAVHYYGGTSKRERPIHEARFRNDPKCRWLVGQYQAGGQGLDFSAASDIFWYSHTTDLLRRRQADERATKVGGRRIGVTDLVAVGSNDEKMLMNLDSKEVTADYLTGQGLRDYLNLIR